jgi:branched-chain amino acid transport system substrate-binding protein
MEIANQSPDRVLLLGPLQVIQNRAQLPLPPSRKVRALLAYLAMAPRPVTREKLCELLWDVADDPRSELRWCLSKLRPLIDAPAATRLIADRERVWIDTSSLDIDAISLTRSAQVTLTSGSPGDLQSLRTLFCGDFLEGLSVDRVPLFDNWLAGQRHRFGQLHQQLLERLSAVLPPESDDRIGVLRECIEVAPFDEAAHIELIHTLLRHALYNEAEHQIDASVARFQSEGVDPTSLKSALAAMQRSASKPARTSLVDAAHLDAPSSQQGVCTRIPNPMQRTSGPWRIGVLFSRTGFMSVIEETQYQGTLLAVEEVNDAGGVCGCELVPVAYDPASDSMAYGHYAKRLMVEDQVRTIFGCYTSSSRKAVLPVVERLNGLLWYPTLYEGFEASPNVIYTGASPNQNSLLLCRYLMDTFGTRFYFVGSDYIYPRQSNRVMRELLRANGGSVVGERYVNLRAHRQEFLPIIQDIKRLRPDAIFSTVVGEGTIFLYQAYADAGLDPKQMPIASLTTTEAEIAGMGFDVGAGHITAAPYFQGIEGSANNAFVQRFKKRLGADISTNMCAEASYFQLHLFVKALEQATTLDTEVLRSMVLGASFQAPQGAVRVNPMSGHTDLWTRIGRANREGQFDVVSQSKEPVHADPFLIGYGRATAKQEMPNERKVA